MKVLTLLLSSVILVGCVTPVKRAFPEPVQELMAQCPELKEIPSDTTKLSDAILVISENYGQYHICRAKVKAWIEWYNDQKNIYNSVK